jgi:hypothetical protein
MMPRQEGDARQKTLDFNWGSWFRAVEELNIPEEAKILLRAIQTFQRDQPTCWPSIDTLTRRVRLWKSPHTTRKYLVWLTAAGFITVTPRSREDGSHSSHEIAIIHSRVFADRSEMQQGGVLQSLQGGTAKFAGGYCKICTPTNNHSFKYQSFKTHDVHATNGISKKEPGTTPPKTGPKPGWIRWGRSITTSDLLEIATLHELFGIAVAKGFRANTFPHLLEFVARAFDCVRVAKKNPAGLFTWSVTTRAYQLITDGCEEQARRALAADSAETEDFPEAEVGTYFDADVESMKTADATRAATLARLKSLKESEL